MLCLGHRIRMSTQENLLKNRYQLIGQQGAGGMSVVYRALDLALGRQVAVKILRPSLTHDQTFLERFWHEARNVARLQHPNIVTVHDVGQDGNTHYIVMELIDGDDLKKAIRADAPFAIDRALDIAIKICAGIGYAHRAQLVHADVKPQNVLIVDNDNVKVTDFGIAQAFANIDPTKREKVVWGSPHYFSPEQAQGRHPTAASDVYSIGIVLFEMLTGRLPFVGSDQQELALAHIRQPAPHVHEINPNVPEQLDRIIQKVLAKDPGARYRMADQLGRILINYRDQGLGKTNNQQQVFSPAPSTLERIPEVAPTLNSMNNPSEPNPVYPDPAFEEAQRQNRSPFAPPDSPDYTAPKLEPIAAQTQQHQQPFAQAPITLPSAGPINGGYTSPNTYYTRPDHMRESGYFTPTDPPGLDIVTLLLGFIAFLAVLGMIILWVFVFQAYT